MSMDDRLAAAFGNAEMLETSLDDWLGAAVPTAVQGAGEPERVLPAADEDRADRILGRIRRIDAERARISEIAERRIAEIRAWEADLTSGLATERERASESLELFTREWHRANPKRKSVKLANGTLALRDPGRGRVDVTDETAFKRWAHEHPEAADVIRWQPEPNRDALRAIEERHTRPDETIIDPRTGDEALYHTWGLLVPVAAEHGEVMQAEVPGVRYVQRVHDKFSVKTADEMKQADPSEEQA